METIFSDRIKKIKRERARLEEILNVKISIKGNGVFLEGEPEDEYFARKVIDALTFGFNFEDKLAMTDRKIGNLPIKTSLAFFNSAGAHFGKNTVILETSAITGKVQYDITKSANVYLKGDAGILNAGYFAGKPSAGIGVKATIGAELGPVFLEGFKEENTNTYSMGFTLGIKL